MLDTQTATFAALAQGLSEAAFESDLAGAQHPDRDPVQTMQRRARARTRAYRATLPLQSRGELPARAAATLARAAAAREAMQVAQVAELGAAADWAALHPAPPTSSGSGAARGGEQAVAVAGEGAPLMAESPSPSWRSGWAWPPTPAGS